MYGVSRGSRWRGGHIGCGSRSLRSRGRGRVESRLVRVMRPGRRVYRFFRGAFLYVERVRADAAFANLAVEGGKGRMGRSHLNVLTFFPLTGGCAEGLGAF